MSTPGRGKKRKNVRFDKADTENPLCPCRSIHPEIMPADNQINAPQIYWDVKNNG
jgi:hypothetical protein